MKLVKKLLRLLPLFVIIGVLFISFSKNNGFLVRESTSNNSSNNTSNTNYFYNSFYQVFDDELIGVVSQYADELPLYAQIENVFDDITGYQYNEFNNSYLRFSLVVLIYELYLSFMFLIFDVFNFMLGVANKWIKKGGNLDD